MRGYRRPWQTWWLFFALAGTAVAVLLWPGPVVLLTWLFGGTLGLATVTAVGAGDEATPSFDDLTARQVLTGALVGAVVASGAAGWVGVSGAGGVALVACAALTSPPCVSRLWALLGPGSDPTPSTAPPLQVSGSGGSTLARAARLMSTAQLCAVWRQTFTDVEQPDDPEQQLCALRLREVVLDELTRRDPEGLDAWMSSTLPVEAAPTLFLRADPPDVSS
jgi:hypothetical protein